MPRVEPIEFLKLSVDSAGNFLSFLLVFVSFFILVSLLLSFVGGRTRNERYVVIVLVAIFRRLKMWHRLYFVPSDGAKIK